MHFDPMPKKVQVFDFIEGDVSGAFMVLGIHDKNAKMPAPKGDAIYEELVKTYPYALPEEWFKTDSVTVRGRIEDYDSEQSGFTQMTLFFIAWAVCGAFHLGSGRFGALAQLGARNTGSVEVTGSNPVCSIW